MKHLRHILLLLLAAVVCGCTHNNGDIGHLFGTWRLDSITKTTMTEDSSAPDHQMEEVDNIFWCFQNKVVMMERVSGHGDNVKRFGSWIREDERLLLDFTHSDDKNPSGSGQYAILDGIYLPSKCVVTMEIMQLDASRMSLEYKNDVEGVTYKYYFSKW